jgi:hypothetical protein
MSPPRLFGTSEILLGHLASLLLESVGHDDVVPIAERRESVLSRLETVNLVALMVVLKLAPDLACISHPPKQRLGASFVLLVQTVEILLSEEVGRPCP